jgi:EamA-like transporter family
LARSALHAVLLSLLSWSLLLVASRVLLVSYGLDPWLFTCIQMLAGGVFLVIAGGRGGRRGGALRNPHTWLYGLLRVATAGFFTAALVHTSTANASFMAIMSVPISALLLRLFLSRRPKAWELPGHLLVLAGMALLGGALEGGYSNPALPLMLLSELCVVASTLIAELHPLNRTESTSQRAFLSGVMLLSSAFVMLVAATGLTVAGRWLPDAGMPLPGGLPWLPDPSAILDPYLWISGILVGILLRGPSLFLALKAIHRARTENYLAGMAVLPFMSLALEEAAVASGWLEPSPSPLRGLLSGCVMTLGSLAVLWARMRGRAAEARRAASGVLVPRQRH